MTAQQAPNPATSEPGVEQRPRPTGQVVGTVLSGSVLLILHLTTACIAFLAWITTPGGAWDDDVLAGLTVLVFMGMALALVSALLTVVPVAARWLSKKWFIVPAVLFALTLARWVYIDAVYPEEPDRYKYGSGQLPVIVVGEAYG